jgi:hypothetical protein
MDLSMPIIEPFGNRSGVAPTDWRAFCLGLALKYGFY